MVKHCSSTNGCWDLKLAEFITKKPQQKQNPQTFQCNKYVEIKMFT